LWVGLLLGGSSGGSAWVFLVCLVPAVTGLVISRSARTGLGLLAACMFLLGILRSPDSRWNSASSGVEALPDRFPVVLEVSPVPLSSFDTGRFRARVKDVIAGFPALEGQVVLIDSEAGPACGYRLAGTFRKPGGPLNPFSVDRRAQLRRRGVSGYVSPGPPEEPRSGGAREAGSGPAASGRLRAFRSRIDGLIRRASRGPSSGVLEAMLLGDRRDLPPGVRNLMIRAGTYHVLAISGLHVGIVVLLLVSFITILGLPRVPRVGLAVACVVFYVILTGARPSALRAGMFFTLLSLSRLSQWRIDYPNAVCAAGTVLLLAFPYLAWELGFKLSLGAVFGITLLVPQIHPPRRAHATVTGKILQYVTLGVAAAFSAQVFTLPLVLYHFGRTSVAGFVTNLVVLPLTTLIVAAGLEASIAVLLWDSLARVFMRASAVLADAVLVSMSFATRIFDPLIVTGRPGFWRAIVYYVLLAYLGLAAPRMKRSHKVLLLLAAYVFMLVSIPCRPGERVTATFLYVGDGDACLVETPSGKTLLVDTGPCGEDYDAADLYLGPFLALKGVSRLDAVVITHPHSDHYGGLGTLSENLEIGEIIVGTPEGEPDYERMLAEAVARGAYLREIRRGDVISLDGVALEFLHPSREYAGDLPDPNAASVVFAMEFGQTRFLFTGDVTGEVQEELLALGMIGGCDVLKVPHHGAPNALGSGLLETLGAGWAIISAGSRFRLHPAPETLKSLEISGARTFTTSRDGAVTVTTDGRSIEVSSQMAE